MSFLKSLLGTSEEAMVPTIKGIYMMTCSPGTADRRRHEQLFGRAMQKLEPRIQRLHAQAHKDKPMFHESIQQMSAVPIGYADEEVVGALVPKFKEWIQQKTGSSIDEEKWNDHFLGKVIVSDTVHCVLVYYDT